MTEAPTEISAEARLALKRYTEMTYGDLSDTTRLANYVFSAGFRAAIQAMVEFQDLPGQLRRVEDKVATIAAIFERVGEGER